MSDIERLLASATEDGSQSDTLAIEEILSRGRRSVLRRRISAATGVAVGLTAVVGGVTGEVAGIQVPGSVSRVLVSLAGEKTPREGLMTKFGGYYTIGWPQTEGNASYVNGRIRGYDVKGNLVYDETTSFPRSTSLVFLEAWRRPHVAVLRRPDESAGEDCDEDDEVQAQDA